MKKMDATTMSADQLISRYGIRDGEDYGRPGTIVPTYTINVKDDGQTAVLAAIKAAKPEIIKIFVAKKAAKEEESRKRAERQAKIDAIPGLREIRDAQNAQADYRYRFNRSFEGKYAVGGMGVGPRPDVDVDALKAQYPTAAAYLRMEEKANSDNYELSWIGNKAIDALLGGMDYAAALGQMDTDVEAFTNRHMWD